MTTFLRITRLVVNQLMSLCYVASMRELSLYFRCIYMKTMSYSRDVINTCDDTIYNLSTYVCD